MRVWKVEEIREKLQHNDEMVRRSLVKLYEKQTEEEKAERFVNNTNGVGFNKIDSSFLSSLAEQVLEGRYLSRKQIDIARDKLLKYSSQLTKIANGEV